METVYDKDGNEIQLPATVQEITEGLAKKAELEKSIQEKDEKLKGYEDKEFNFKKLRDLTEEQKATYTAKELELKQAQEKLEEQQGTMQQTLINNWKEKTLYFMAGSDGELKNKILAEFDNLTGVAKSEVEVAEKMKKAFMLVTGSQPQVDPIKASFGDLGGLPPKEMPTGDKKVSPELVALGKVMGVSEEDFKKAGFKS